MPRVLFLNKGCHRKNEHGLRLGCKELGYELVETKDESYLTQEFELVVIPNGMYPPSRIPLAKRILYGPHNFVFPEGRWIEETWDDSRCFYNTLSEWNKQVHEEYPPVCCPLVTFPFGVDIYQFSEKKECDNYMYDCFIYFKNRHSDHLSIVETFCKQKGLKYTILKYGQYTEAEYKRILYSSKFGIWIGTHESQGFGLQEALATNTPLVVWDATSMFDQVYSNNVPIFHAIRDKKLRATSCPYWSDECGIRVTSRDDLSKAIDQMNVMWTEYMPREFVERVLAPGVCLTRMIEYKDKKD